MSSQMVPSTSVATNDSGRRWSLAYMDVTEPPSEFIVHQGQTINQLDLSNNRISDLRFLSEFPALTTLVLDHNRISSHVKIPRMPHLHTLWVNHNRIKNLGIFVSMLAYSCPNLQYLSMMNNEAAPSFFNGGTFSQYQDFRSESSVGNHQRVNEAPSPNFQKLTIVLLLSIASTHTAYIMASPKGHIFLIGIESQFAVHNHHISLFLNYL
ncbi:leucine-rich melanocyte differentiation-associated protein-like isoform X1 [Pomacea canaliculata]|uniref:leucine-rich melanocyte differentiation-associated protein-like isoform X1 n=1 Tax=Pomacea canaliculata TaxID=400727 RepID=UPI000D72D041|nr:leucine-rich melanocyte differentiation-associated protein-like isoform X1 [Pomacea canaliculata]